MQIGLIRNPDEQKQRFATTSTAEDVADLLEVSYSTLVYHLYRVPSSNRYKAFEVKKRSGGTRLIRAPSTNLKILQQKLAEVLANVYRPQASVHGFVRGRSSVTNARPHLRARWVLNVDLEDFFPSINFGRVRGVFIAAPLGRPSPAATTLAHLCCHSNELPQGAPTSPVVSNLIAAKLDSDLRALAARNGCRYSRYADDLTFSTNRPEFPEELASFVSIGSQVRIGVGPDLEQIIVNNGFRVSIPKVHLHHRTERQLVTGVVVNERLNVRRKYVRELRAILHSWDVLAYAGAAAKYTAKYGNPDANPSLPAAELKDVIKGKLGYLAMVRGNSDGIVNKYRSEFARLRARDGV